MANATSTQLQELYVAYFGRAADPTGLDYWTEKGITTSKFAADMYAQAEFKDAYGSLSTESQVNQIYTNLFDRDADATGLLYWTKQIDLGNIQIAEIATHLIWAAQNNSGSEDDKTALSNKTTAAVAYTAKVKESTSAILAYQAESTSPWKSGVNIEEAVSYMSGIDKDTASTTAGIAASVTTITGNGVPSLTENYTLTSGVDDINGTAGTNKFQAGLTTSGGNTLNSLDELDGGAGTDTLNASIATSITPGSIKNIENVNLTFEGTAKTFNANNVTGITTLTDIASTALGITSNIGTTSTNIKVSDNSVGATFTYKSSAVSGSSDSLGLTLANATGAGITTITGAIETVNLTSSISANSVQLNSTASTLNISGSEDLTLAAASTILDQTTTIDASAATGNISLASNNTAAAGAVTITGGSGNDTLTSTGTNTATDTVSGGAGNDTITFTGDLADADVINGGAGTDTLVSTSALLAGLTTANNISNIETLKASDVLASATLTVATVDSTISSVELAVGANAGVVTFGAGTNTLTMGAASAGLLTVNDTGLATNDTLTINSSTVDSFNNNAVAVNGFETVNFSTGTGTTTAAQTVSTINITGDPDAAGLRTSSTLNISGKGNLTASGIITVGTDGSGTGTIDASGLTGNLVMTAGAEVAGATTIIGGSGSDTLLGDSHASTITGGAGNDSITGGAASDTISGGAGNDTLTLTLGGAGINDTITGGAGNDTFSTTTANLTAGHVLSGGTGTDNLTVSGTLTAIADSRFENNTSIELLTSGVTGLSATLDVYAQAMGITTITFAGTNSAGVADTVTIQDDVTNAVTVTLDALNSDGSGTDDSNDVIATTYAGELTVTTASALALTGNNTSNAAAGDTTVTGGTGTSDTLNFHGGTFTSTHLGTITAIENWTQSDDVSSSLTLADANIADGKSLTIDLRSIINSGNTGAVNLALDSNGSTTVHGGTGVDTITGSISDLGDTINGYAGADVIKFKAAQLTTLDTVDGGTGSDTLQIIDTAATLADADFTGISNIEALTFVTIASSDTDLGAQYSESGSSTITLAVTTNDLNLDSVTTAQTLNLVAGTDTIDASSMTAALTVNVDSNDITSADTITAGTGTGDILEIDYDTSATAASALNNVTGFETIKFADGDAANSVTLVDGNVAATKSLTIDATVNASTVSTITMSAETNGAVTILGGAGGNTVTLSASSLGDTFTGGAGTDGLTVAVAQLTSADTLNGVSGTDTITLSDAGSIADSDLTGVSNFDGFTLADGANTIVFGAEFEESGISTVTGGTGADTITFGAGVTSAVTVALGTSTGDDTISFEAASGAATFTVNEDGLDASDTITGGTGSDTLTITFDGTGITSAEAVGVTKVETIKTATNAVGSLTLNDANNVSSVVTIDATANTTRAFTLDASAENDGTITYTGGGGVDTVTGTDTTATGDTISTGAGADVITGGLGGDTITGGAGADTFTYTAVAQSTGSARDSITDYTSGTDLFSFTINNSTNTSGQTYDATIQTARAGTSLVQSNLSGSIGQAIYDTTNSRLIVNANADNLVTTLDWQIDLNAATTAASTVAAGDIGFIITAGSGVDTITTGGGADTITGGAGKDIIVSGNGADTITGGDGADTMTGGTGVDTFKWTGTTAALIATESGTTAGTDVDFASGSIGDDLISFTSGADILYFDDALVTNADGTEVDTLKTIAATGIVTATDRFVEITASFNGTTGDAIIDLNACTTTAVAQGDSFIAFMHDDTDGYLYLVQQAGTANTIAAGDVTLIGQVSGVTNIANGDFVSF